MRKCFGIQDRFYSMPNVSVSPLYFYPSFNYISC